MSSCQLTDNLFSISHNYRSWNVCLLVVVAILCGCSGDTATEHFDEYNARLARSLKLDVVKDVSPVIPIRRPRKREMVLEKNSTTISVLDFLRLNGCVLGEVVGQRNSILGKVAPASQLLFNDLAFLEYAPACIQQLHEENRVSLAKKLSEAAVIKRDELAMSIANATLASAEFSDLWHVPGALSEISVNDGNSAIAELHYVESQIAGWLAGDFTHDSIRFENALGQLRYGGAGSLLAAAALTKYKLESANRMLQERRQGRPLCFNRIPSRSGQILKQVVTKFFVGEIQVWLSRVNALRYDILAPYEAIEQHLANAQSPGYRRWRDQRNRQLAWLSDAPRQHVEKLLPVLQSCGLAPGEQTSKNPE